MDQNLLKKNNRIQPYFDNQFVYTDAIDEYCNRISDLIDVAEKGLDDEYNIILPKFDMKFKHDEMDDHYGISYNKLIDDLTRGVLEIKESDFNVIKHSSTKSVSFREDSGYNYVILRFPDKFNYPMSYVFTSDESDNDQPEFDIEETLDSKSISLEDDEFDKEKVI